MIRTMPALGLDPRVDTGLPKPSCAVKTPEAGSEPLRLDRTLRARRSPPGFDARATRDTENEIELLRARRRAWGSSGRGGDCKANRLAPIRTFCASVRPKTRS